tara:strand:+ start:140 stop:406 length:267 start_codon:yes stop_codon:yes gene_type:complete
MDLNKDYDWARVIGKRDSVLLQTIEEDMGQVILDYLRVGSEEDLTEENIDELLKVREFLGGKGFTFENSLHFEVLYNNIQMLSDEFTQ